MIPSVLVSNLRTAPRWLTLLYALVAAGFGQQIYRVEGLKLVLNYGLNRVRFPTPVKVGARVRLVCDLVEVKVTSQGVQTTTKNTFEVEGEEKPACVAEALARMFF